jgi:hypothetical protein
MSAATDYMETALLDHALKGTAYSQPANIYVSLHSAANSDSAPSTGEITGGSYARQACTSSFAAAASPGGTKATNADLTWTNMPATTVTYIAIWDSVTGGNGLFWGSLSASKTVNGGDTFKILSGQLTVSLA